LCATATATIFVNWHEILLLQQNLKSKRARIIPYTHLSGRIGQDPTFGY
jgi:hypothetical protein